MKKIYIGKHRTITGKYRHSMTENPSLIFKKLLLLDVDAKNPRIFLIDGFSLFGTYKYPEDRKYLLFEDGKFLDNIYKEFSKALKDELKCFYTIQ